MLLAATSPLLIRSAEGQLDRIPDLTAELVSRQVDVICATTPAALAAKAATQSFPMTWSAGDPVAMGLVTSLNHPERNILNPSSSREVVAKRLDWRQRQLRLLFSSIRTIQFFRG